MRTLLFIVLLPMLASAEFLKIEMGFGGMECASCGEFIQGKLGKQAGVKSVNVDRTKGLVIMELAPGNKIKMEQVRSMVQQSGFTPADAAVTVYGVPRMDRGVSTVEILPGYSLRGYDPNLEMRELVGKKAEITGTVRILKDKGGIEALEIKKAKVVK